MGIIKTIQLFLDLLELAKEAIELLEDPKRLEENCKGSADGLKSLVGKIEEL